MNLAIRATSTEDHASIHALLQAAFGGDAEARLVADLRAGGFSRVEQVAVRDHRIVGHILLSAIEIATPAAILPALALAPLAVAPDQQRQGIGSQLIEAGLNACREAGHAVVIVLGHPAYYTRFGFSAARAAPLRSPYAGPAFMALELVPHALANVEGEVHYSPPFSWF